MGEDDEWYEDLHEEDVELLDELDVEIENISMLVTQKQENIAIIRQNQGQFSSLIDAMKQRSQSNN